MPFILDIKVVPNSGRVAWTIDKCGQLKCYLKNPPALLTALGID